MGNEQTFCLLILSKTFNIYVTGTVNLKLFRRQRLGNEQTFCFLILYHLGDSFPAFAEAKFFDEIQTKVLRVFLLVIHSHIYLVPTALFEIYISSNSRNQFL
jgi:hypothetical protein